MENAKDLSADIHFKPRLNQNTGKNEFSLWDLDGYNIIVSE